MGGLLVVDFTHIVAYLDVDENTPIRYLSTSKKISSDEEWVSPGFSLDKG